MKIVAIIQARMASSRLPKKILTDICGKPMLWHIVERVKQSSLINNVVIATSDEKEDDEVEIFANQYSIPYYRGSQLNVLDRFWKCANQYSTDIVVRLTGDNALIDSEIIDEALNVFIGQEKIDYLYYCEGLPIGMAVEIMKFSALTRAHDEASDMECLEHVTPYLYKNSDEFVSLRVKSKEDDHSELRWTMDTVEDKKLILSIYEVLYDKNRIFHYKDILMAYKKHPEWAMINNEIMQKKVEYRGEKDEV
ncbi:glycosyltransferase family protein [Anaerosporobacter sp.]|uniref:glycosyltransferase family protein n=1 Tax=Anaerosporobacter sp. TaxID=1872529 RepID=UPI00286F147C|nr:glycosyltransferase family protein [Anaerosporobacter sp.]